MRTGGLKDADLKERPCAGYGGLLSLAVAIAHVTSGSVFDFLTLTLLIYLIFFFNGAIDSFFELFIVIACTRAIELFDLQ